MRQSSFLSGSLPAGVSENNTKNRLYRINVDEYVFTYIQDIADWCADKGITDKVEIKDFMNIDAVKEFVPDKVTYSEK